MTRGEMDGLARRAGLRPSKMKFVVNFVKEGPHTISYVSSPTRDVEGVGIARRNPKDKIDRPEHAERLALRRAFEFIRRERIEELFFA